MIELVVKSMENKNTNEMKGGKRNEKKIKEKE